VNFSLRTNSIISLDSVIQFYICSAKGRAKGGGGWNRSISECHYNYFIWRGPNLYFTRPTGKAQFVPFPIQEGIILSLYNTPEGRGGGTTAHSASRTNSRSFVGASVIQFYCIWVSVLSLTKGEGGAWTTAHKFPDPTQLFSFVIQFYTWAVIHIQYRFKGGGGGIKINFFLTDLSTQFLICSVKGILRKGASVHPLVNFMNQVNPFLHISVHLAFICSVKGILKRGGGHHFIQFLSS
jgi:hypothetical protein